MFLVFRFFITLIAVLLIWKVVPGFEIKNDTDAFFFAVILSAVNAIIRPVLTLITLPITILSYGVHFHTFSALFWGAFAVWLTGFITNRFIWRVNIY